MTGPAPLELPPRASKDVAKYLLPEERAVVATRRHWAVLIGPTLKALPFVVAGGWLLLYDPENRVSRSAGLLDAVPCMSPCSWDHLMTLCPGPLAYGL